MPPTAVTMLVRRAAEHMLLCDSAVVAAIAATLRTQRSELPTESVGVVDLERNRVTELVNGGEGPRSGYER